MFDTKIKTAPLEIKIKTAPLEIEPLEIEPGLTPGRGKLKTFSCDPSTLSLSVNLRKHPQGGMTFEKKLTRH